MDANLKGALDNLHIVWFCAEHKGSKMSRLMSKADFKKLIQNGIKKGYENLSEISDEEIDLIIKK